MISLMLKLILPIIFLSIIVGVIVFFFLNKDKKVEPKNPINQVAETFSNDSVSGGDLPREVPKDLPTPSSSPIKATGNSTDEKIKSLEALIDSLTKRVATLEQSGNTTQVVPPSTTTTTTTSTSKSPLYIPLGTGGGTSAFDWTTINTSEVEIDPADYPGYTNMYLQVELRTFQGNGTAYARLINYTDSSGLTSSETSTTSENYTTVSSGGFKLSSGKKKYRLQLKTLTGYEASTQNVRIKVTF